MDPILGKMLTRRGVGTYEVDGGHVYEVFERRDGRLVARPVPPEHYADEVPRYRQPRYDERWRYDEPPYEAPRSRRADRRPQYDDEIQVRPSSRRGGGIIERGEDVIHRAEDKIHDVEKQAGGWFHRTFGGFLGNSFLRNAAKVLSWGAVGVGTVVTAGAGITMAAHPVMGMHGPMAGILAGGLIAGAGAAGVWVTRDKPKPASDDGHGGHHDEGYYDHDGHGHHLDHDFIVDDHGGND